MRRAGHVHMADGVSDHRHQQLAAVLAAHLEHLAGGELKQAADGAHLRCAVAHRAPPQFVRPPLSLHECGHVGAGDRERLPAQGLHGRAIPDAFQTHDRPLLDTRAAHDPQGASGDGYLAPQPAAGGSARVT